MAVHISNIMNQIFTMRYRLFDVLPKQATCEMKTIQVQFYIQQSVREKQGEKFIQVLTFLVGPEITLGMHLSTGGRLYM